MADANQEFWRRTNAKINASQESKTPFGFPEKGKQMVSQRKSEEVSVVTNYGTIALKLTPQGLLALGVVAILLASLDN